MLTRCALVGLVLGACAEEPAKLTQIVVVVDSDLSVPDQLDRLQVDLSGAKQMRVIDTPVDTLPRSLGLLYSGGPLGPVRVTARGVHGEDVVVERVAEVHFRKDRTLKLALALTRSCAELEQDCEGELTCDQGECVPVAMTLPLFDGNDGPLPLDAGWSPDAGPDADAASGDGGFVAADGGDAGGQEAGVDPTVTCAINAPADDEKFYQGDAIAFDGSCLASDGAALEVRWDTKLKKLGPGNQLTRDNLPVGTHEIKLCAKDKTNCAAVEIEVQALPELSATIKSLAQQGASADVFSTEAELVASGEGSGVPPLELKWIDSFAGELCSSATCSMIAPLLPGRHMLRLVVKDGRGRVAQAERGFVVRAPNRSALFESYAGVNSVLNVLGTIKALGSAGAYYYAGTDQGRVMRVPASGSPATVTPNVTLTNIGAGTNNPGVNDIFIDESAKKLYVATNVDIQTCDITPDGVNACQLLALPNLPLIPRCVRKVGGPGNEYLVVGTSKGLWLGAMSKLDQGVVHQANHVFNGLTESAGKLWIASSGGLSAYTLGGPISGPPQAFAGASGGLNAIVASGDVIWGALTGGIARYDAGEDKWTHWTMASTDAVFGRLVNNDIRSIAITHPVIEEGAHDVIWVGTGAGLSRFDPAIPSFTTYTKVDGLPDNTVLELTGLPSNELLLATPSGLSIHRGQ